MFRVSQYPSSGVLKTVTAASGTGHNIGTATFFQRGQILKFIDAKQVKEIHHYKNTKRKLFRRNAVRWYNK